jgi:prolipoprotein diacylglyceryltransferase
LIETWLHPGIGLLGITASMHTYLRELERSGLNSRPVPALLVITLAVGVVLARVAFGLEHRLGWEETLRPAPGGYVLYGALPSVLLFAVWIRLLGLRPRTYLDRAAPFVLFALVPARIGCWIVGCCGGTPIESVFPGAHVRHVFPVPLGAAALNALLGGLLLLRMRRRTGGTAALSLAGHGLARTLLDTLRERSVTQGGAAALLALCGILWFWSEQRRSVRC